jgi:hypothetical protein
MTFRRGAAGGTPGWAGGDCGVVGQPRLEGQPACTASASAHRSSACASQNAHWGRADACRSHKHRGRAGMPPHADAGPNGGATAAHGRHVCTGTSCCCDYSGPWAPYSFVVPIEEEP